MEHEAFVPFPVETVRRALSEPDRVARCVSALHSESVSPVGVLSGRLRLRIGGSTITYRGSVRIAACDGGFEVEGEGTETRGTGSVKAALVVGLEPEAGGTRLGFSGAVQADGRLAEYDQATAETAGRRVLDRFVAELTTDMKAEPPLQQAEPGVPAQPQQHIDDLAGSAAGGEPAAGDQEAGEATPPGEAARASDEGEERAGSARSEAAAEAGDHPGPEDLFRDAGAEGAGGSGGAEEGEPADTEAGPTSGAPGAEPDAVEAEAEIDAEIDADADLMDVVGIDVPENVADLEDEASLGGAVPAEAAHARRTMIGRSAEEVDHAPPRGPYAPVSPPRTGSGNAALRWAGPAAAALLASAVVVRQVLRRRR